MTNNDLLANALSNIYNAAKIGKEFCLVSPVSNIIKTVLQIMKDKGYIGEVTFEEGRGGTFKVNLLGTLNRCGAIKPRYNVKKNEYEKFEKRYLPGKDFGFLVISTSQGVLTQAEAKEKNIGGRLLMYFY
ncbi:30S ribosomal protein S8 [Candidatus Woesearchaeota archaeon]|nr:30S ribosomal protein S8 [Candidatus Woesearchaeota archaeon]